MKTSVIKSTHECRNGLLESRAMQSLTERTHIRLTLKSANQILWIFSAFLIALCSTFWQKAYAKENVLIIIADDLGQDSLGLYEKNNTTAPTPNINALAQQGMTFNNAWANPVCSPTRATLLSGKYGFRTGITTVVGGRNGVDGITPDTYTLFDALKELAPESIGNSVVGKWHLNDDTNGGEDNPNMMGVDYFSGLVTGPFDYFQWEKTVNGVTNTVNNYSATENVDDSIAWIDQQDGPWLNWLAFMSPHSPFHKPPVDLHSYDDLPDDSAEVRANPLPYYQAMIEAMDTEIGRLTDYLKSTDQYDNTTILFLGDNGTPGQVVAAPYDPNKAKGSLYQGGINVPFVISGAAVDLKGTTSDELVNAVDIFSTTLELFGIGKEQLPPEVVIDSQSLLPILRGNSGSRQYSYSEVRGLSDTGDGRAIRNATYKLISFDDGREELYNLIEDPSEGTNLLLGSLTSPDRNALNDLRAGYQSIGVTQPSPVPTSTPIPTSAPTPSPTPTVTPTPSATPAPSATPRPNRFMRLRRANL